METKVMLCNTVCLVCFTVLAIVFETWWIVLFAVLFLSYIEYGEKK